MRVEPEVLLALRNLATLNHLGDGLTIPTFAMDAQSDGLKEERKRISRELHDGVAQELQAIVMHLRLALAANSREAASHATSTALAIAERGVAMTRSLLADLHGHPRATGAPSQSLAGALTDTLGEATRYSILEVKLQVEEGVRISDSVHAELMCMVREIATNAIKHGKATTLTCVAQKDAASACQIEIRDDGVGFNVASTVSGCGIRGLRERARRISGTVLIESETGRGTVVRLSFPII